MLRNRLAAVVREASRTNASLRLEVYLFVALVAALVFLVAASSLLETPVYPEGLDASLVPVRPVVVRIINTVDRFAKRLLSVDLYVLRRPCYSLSNVHDIAVNDYSLPVHCLRLGIRWMFKPCLHKPSLMRVDYRTLEIQALWKGWSRLHNPFLKRKG